MSYYFKNLKPDLNSDVEEDDGNLLESIMANKSKREIDEQESSDDELKTLSFGSLKKAETVIDEEDFKDTKPVHKNRSQLHTEKKVLMKMRTVRTNQTRMLDSLKKIVRMKLIMVRKYQKEEQTRSSRTIIQEKGTTSPKYPWAGNTEE